MPPERQIELLEQDYQQARSANQPVPPGFHAYLGYLYYAVGRADQARQEFETEKANFPESTVLMDRRWPGCPRDEGRLARDRALAALGGLAASGCAAKPFDYTNYRAYPPHRFSSFLRQRRHRRPRDVRLPVHRDQADRRAGYYVSVALIDQLLKENGMPTPGEMVQAPLGKIREIVGADAVLYITIKQYGTRFQLLASTTAVTAARLVDTRTGTLLWEGRVAAEEGSGGSGNILADVIGALLTQVINQSTDHAHSVAERANAQFAVKDRGLLYGPYSPKYGTE
jgi:hypothetical protein